ncbi:MAG: UDP-N-acetylmuramoyl-tripeptide--D-alanyl-D-alanine ligase [Bacteroidia bacterium]|jgi:UDP-N-acetylmuramoyl-tripeptide--D-alanyl-D-alanine ligase
MNTKVFYSIFIQQNQAFTTDTRKVSAGDIYFALKGANFNGNTFAQQALDAGAEYVVVDEEVEVSSPTKVVKVNNVLSFMQALATHHRRQFTCPVLAVGGSNGKTTTKELLTAVLSQKFTVHATPGNFNNHIGVPISLLQAPLNANFLIIEIGTNNFGEIKFLSELVEPSCGLLTNIGKEHLEGFGDIEGVAKEESELYSYLLKSGGLTFVNANDSYLIRMAHRLSIKQSYGVDKEGIDFNFTLNQSFPNVVLSHNDNKYEAAISGDHNAQNVAAATTVALHFGLNYSEIKKGLQGYKPSNNRSEIRIVGSNTFILDAYNANPSSMEAAINAFDLLNQSNRLVILGDMFEMGKTSVEEHKRIIELLLTKNDLPFILAGLAFQTAAQSFDIESFKDVDEVIENLKSQPLQDHWILVKGSRGMKMERVVEAF